MFNAIIKVVNHFEKVAKAAHKAAVGNIFHAAASIRKDAMASIQKAPKEGRVRGKKGKRRPRHAASPPGTPPFTSRGALKNAIIFAVDSKAPSAVVGPRGSRVGASAQAHEFGGSYKGQDYPERPFMHPALERGLAKFAGSFAGSIGD